VASLGIALLIWPIAIAIAVWFIVADYMIQVAVAITAGTFLIALVYLRWSTWMTSRRDRLGSQEMPQDRA
jgi:hypothetical protein